MNTGNLGVKHSEYWEYSTKMKAIDLSWAGKTGVVFNHPRTPARSILGQPQSLRRHSGVDLCSDRSSVLRIAHKRVTLSRAKIYLSFWHIQVKRKKALPAFVNQ